MKHISKPILGTQLNWAHPLAKGLVGFWLFNEGSGNKVQDLSMNGNHGTVVGASRVPGKDGMALSFDNLDDYVAILDNPTLRFTDKFTISALIYPLGWGENSVGRIFDKNTAATNDGYMFYLNNTITAGLTVGLNTSFHNSSANVAVLNKWQRMTVTFGAGLTSNQIRFYVNGVPAGVATKTTAITTSTIVANIGNRLDTERTFNGTIDNVQVWNRALFAQEILDLQIAPYSMFL